MVLVYEDAACTWLYMQLKKQSTKSITEYQTEDHHHLVFAIAAIYIGFS